MAEIILFPTAKRTGRIRRVAEVLADRRGRSAETYWSRVIDDMARQMTRAGIEPETISRELEDFRRAVAGAMVRQGGVA